MSDTTFIEFTLDHYRAVELLGKGGFGTVYRAIDTTLDREVALKVLHPQLVADPTFVERFRTEAKIIAALRHPNVVGVYELGEEGGRLFIAMEYMPGGTLKERLAQRGRLSFDETLAIVQQVCAGLDAAHAEGMLHRDIKPGNILFDKRGNAVVGDFGLARAMQLSSIASASSSSGGVGTPFYKAPELWRGKPPASPATDVYALTCMVYEMLTGRVLFGGDTPDEVITKHLVDGPDFGTDWPPADTPQGLTEVIQRGLARNPEERYASATALADALLNLRAQPQKSVAVATPATDVVAPAKQPMQQTLNNKSKLPIWGIAAAGLAAVLLLGVVLGRTGLSSSPAAVAPTQTFVASPTVAVLSSETATLEPTPTNTPTAKPSDTPIVTATPKPSETPTPKPSNTPKPTLLPTLVPKRTSTPRPISTTTSAPSNAAVTFGQLTYGPNRQAVSSGTHLGNGTTIYFTVKAGRDLSISSRGIGVRSSGQTGSPSFFHGKATFLQSSWALNIGTTPDVSFNLLPGDVVLIEVYLDRLSCNQCQIFPSVYMGDYGTTVIKPDVVNGIWIQGPVYDVSSP